MSDDKDRDELARIIVGERYSGRRYSGSNPLENPLDARLVDRILESDWFKERLVKEWKYGYDRALLDERLRKSSGW